MAELPGNVKEAFVRTERYHHATKELGLYPYDPEVLVKKDTALEITHPEDVATFKHNHKLDAEPALADKLANVKSIKGVETKLPELPENDKAISVQLLDAEGKEVAKLTKLPRYNYNEKDKAVGEKLGERTEIHTTNKEGKPVYVSNETLVDREGDPIKTSKTLVEVTSDNKIHVKVKAPGKEHDHNFPPEAIKGAQEPTQESSAVKLDNIDAAVKAAEARFGAPRDIISITEGVAQNTPGQQANRGASKGVA